MVYTVMNVCINPGRSWEGIERLRALARWLTDKYGVSWQIVPTVLGEMLQDKNAERAERVMQAMLQMKKIDINALKQAYGQK